MKKTVIILAGGLSTRFEELGDKPKCLLDLYDKPTLIWLVTFLQEKGFEVILSLGHLAEEILSSFHRRGVKVNFVKEDNPLETGGAIRYALEKVEDENFIVLNADTINNYSRIKDAFDFHVEKRNLITHVVAKTSNQNEGKIIVEGNKVVENFERDELTEIPLKPGQESFSSTGVYVINKKYFSNLVKPAEKISLEKDILPPQTKMRIVSSFDLISENRDLGTIDRYRTFLSDYTFDKFKKLFE